MIFEVGKKNVYNWSNGTYNQVQEDVKLATRQQIEEAKNMLAKIKSTNITTEGKIYFQKQAVFPRNRLKDVVDNQVTRKIENAEYVVINTELTREILKKTWARPWTKGPVDLFWTENYFPVGGQVKEEFVDSNYNSNLFYVMDFLDSIGDKKVILDEDLGALIPREVEIKGDLVNKLHKMLGSKDKATIKVGVQILSNLDYNKFDIETVLILNKNIQNIRAYQAHHTVVFKSLIKTVERDFPDWDTGNRLEFILSLIEAKPESQLAIQYLGEYLNEVYPLSEGKSFQINIIEEIAKEKLSELEV